jgi:hypothetical protein
MEGPQENRKQKRRRIGMQESRNAGVQERRFAGEKECRKAGRRRRLNGIRLFFV